MGGDYTRFTFDPVKEFSGVRKQQGRVSLDADFNEFEEILDRRRRAQMYDTVGSVGRAVVPMTTPNAFKIGLSGTQLTIGAGRAYVDGILVECFGDMGPNQPINQDDVLGGIRGAGPLPFDKQPFYYSSYYPGLLTGANAINTVYLDVWQREVTVFEDDALREPALNGPDTATRVQTAWQVKVMTRPATSSNCASTPAGWDTLVAASTARLTAKADGVLAPPPGPCEINPAGGYTGLENRLYRVEVHSTGTISGVSGGAPRAQFKWSRDNASFAARVSAASRSGTQWTIKVSSTGPDGWTRFDQGDHIELLDDDDEFAMRDRGYGGRMMKVVSVDHANHELVAESPSVGPFTVRPERHPRIRRWDYLSATEPTLRYADRGVAVPLEHGISITFEGSATDTLHAGDYWVFEARTASGKIGPLVNAPPRGPLHHFAKLGYVTVGQLPTDCRVFWPPVFTGGGAGEGCCTVVVKPGEDIQAAIGSLAGMGGCVCLKMGDHPIAQPLQITDDNITLHAEAPLVTVRLDGTGPEMLSIHGASNVSVLGIRFEAKDGAKGGAMIALNNVRGGRIADCSLGFIGAASNLAWNTIGIRMDRCRDYAIEDNALDHFETGIHGRERCERVRIIGNLLSGSSVGDGSTQRSAGEMGVVFTHVVGIDVEHNLVADYRRGIEIGDLSTSSTLAPLDVGSVEPGCRIAANVIARQGGIAIDNLVVSASNVTAIAFGIAARMPRCEILENAIRLDFNTDSGILADGGNVLIARNLLSSTAEFDASRSAYIIPRGVVAVVTERDARALVIRDNLFTGFQQAVLVGGTGKDASAIQRVEVASNHVAGSEDLYKVLLTLAGNVVASPQGLLDVIEMLASIVMTNLKGGRVAHNDISTAVCAVACGDATEVVVEGNAITKGLAGVVLGFGGECDVADNVIHQVAMGVVVGAARTSVVQRNVLTQTTLGIIDLMGTGTRIQDNDLSGGVIGIELFATEDAEVRGNTVQDASRVGIDAIPVTSVTLAHNTARRCGYGRNASAATLGHGIRVTALDAAVHIESCQALDVGVSSVTADPIFPGRRFGIAVTSVRGRVRVHGCTITSPAIDTKSGGLGANAASRALVITAGKPQPPVGTQPTNNASLEKIESKDGDESIDYADAADNLAEQTATPVVEIEIEGEIIFSANRCRLLDSEPATGPVVRLSGTCIAVTGNRVRAQGGAPSLELMASRALTAVGNATTTDALISGVQELPEPYRAFNVRT